MIENASGTRRRGGRPGTGTHLFLLVCVALCAAFGTWAYFGRLDVVSMAMGEVKPSSQVKAIQHLEGGIVRDIMVSEGEHVLKGQPLIELENVAQRRRRRRARDQRHRASGRDREPRGRGHRGRQAGLRR